MVDVKKIGSLSAGGTFRVTPKNMRGHSYLKGSYDAHFPQVYIILYGLNEKSVT